MKNKIEMYMHQESGDVASIQDWMDDFHNMDVESWFGLPAEDCVGLDWLSGGKLVQVELDEDGEWVEL